MRPDPTRHNSLPKLHPYFPGCGTDTCSGVQTVFSCEYGRFVAQYPGDAKANVAPRGLRHSGEMQARSSRTGLTESHGLLELVEEDTA